MRFTHGDAYALPPADGSVDAVVSRMLFWTLYDPPKAVLEWRRVLAPGGRIVVIDALYFASPTTASTEPNRGRAFWDMQERLERAKRRWRDPAGEQGIVCNPYDVAQPPGMRWQSVADAQAHLVQAGISPVAQGWLETVHAVDRRRAPLRWRIAGRLPSFFTLTWRQPEGIA